MNTLHAPVVLIVFKRLDTTKVVFHAIQLARPQTLFIIADGWRNEVEKEKCLAVRTYLESAVNWPCDVRTNYSDKNLGTKKRITSGLDWVFAQVEEAIILEDDTVPDPSFFYFSQELLNKYRNSERILQIAGANFQQHNRKFSTAGASYYFSQFPEIWGWATWRRAWKLFDADMRAWPRAKEEALLQKRIANPSAADYWEYLFDHVDAAKDDRSKSDVWAAQWVFTHLLHDGLSINPATNLVSNIGTSPDTATRAKGTKGDNIVELPIVPINFPLRHPDHIEPNAQADAYSLAYGWKIKSTMREKILFFLKQRAPALHRFLKKFAQKG